MTERLSHSHFAMLALSKSEMSAFHNDDESYRQQHRNGDCSSSSTFVLQTSSQEASVASIPFSILRSVDRNSSFMEPSLEKDKQARSPCRPPQHHALRMGQTSPTTDAEITLELFMDAGLTPQKSHESLPYTPDSLEKDIGIRLPPPSNGVRRHCTNPVGQTLWMLEVLEDDNEDVQAESPAPMVTVAAAFSPPAQVLRPTATRMQWSCTRSLSHPNVNPPN